MARIRTIKPEFWESESIGRLTMPARLMFIASLNLADDEGLLRWNPAYIMSQAFIYDDVTIEQVSEWMDELVREGIVFAYKAGTTNQKLAWIINFRNHQVINRPQPSKIPHPSIQNPDFKKAIFSRDKGICHLCSESIGHDPVNQCESNAPSLDHIKPISKGGNDYPSNLKTSHISCNKRRKDKPLNESRSNSVNDSVTEREREKEKEKEKEKEVYTPSHVESSVPRDAQKSDFQKIYEAGSAIFPNLATANTSSIRQWITAGCDAELDVIPEIQRYKGRNIGSWKFFTKPVMDANATRLAQPPKGTPRANTIRNNSANPQSNPKPTWRTEGDRLAAKYLEDAEREEQSAVDEIAGASLRIAETVRQNPSGT